MELGTESLKFGYSYIRYIFCSLLRWENDVKMTKKYIIFSKNVKFLLKIKIIDAKSRAKINMSLQ